MTLLYGHQSEEIRQLQLALAQHKFDPGDIDGGFGPNTRDAVEAAQNYFNISPADGVVRGDLLAFLALAAPIIPKPTLFSKIAVILSVINLVKGKPMTADQITGILRAILTAIGGYLVGKGIVDQATATSLIGAAVTIGGAVWSLWSNRPKTITPIGH